MQNKIALMIWTVVFLLLPFVVSAGPIRLAPLPMLDEATSIRQFLPFAHYLSDITGKQVDLVYHQNYKVLLDEFMHDNIDLAYLGPLPFVLLMRENPDFVPLVRFVDADGASTYTCSLVAFDRDILNGNFTSTTPVALTQPYSTCGYLLTEHLLNRQSFSLKNTPFYYAGHHSECALNVIRGKATVAGLKTSIAQQYRHLGLQLIEESEPLPGFLLVANPRTLTAEVIEQIRSSLLSLDPRHNPDDATLTAAWGKNIRYGTIPVQVDDYQHIETQLNQIKIPGVNQ
ncbi:MAG: PhnD/SsuA/transferrin family substrate-binding protein [Desulfuromusa sp.]|nr:PhnD/SsuA/transferrin family substrate-binding protein [Desulfuromusa sp.]